MSASKAHSTIARGVCPHPSLPIVPIVHPTLRSCTGTHLAWKKVKSAAVGYDRIVAQRRCLHAPPQSTLSSAHHFDVSGLNVIIASSANHSIGLRHWQVTDSTERGKDHAFAKLQLEIKMHASYSHDGAVENGRSKREEGYPFMENTSELANLQRGVNPLAFFYFT